MASAATDVQLSLSTPCYGCAAASCTTSCPNWIWADRQDKKPKEVKFYVDDLPITKVQKRKKKSSWLEKQIKRRGWKQ